MTLWLIHTIVILLLTALVPHFHRPSALSDGPLWLCRRPMTTSTHRLNPSISSSTVPPIPVFAKLIEFPTYTGLPTFRAITLASRVVKSNV